MIKQVVGTVIAVVIGGATYGISQTTVQNYFQKNSGMTQSQSKAYVSNAQKNLASFTKIGQEFVSDGNSDIAASAKIDCVNYTYQWVTADLSCDEGAMQLQTIGNDEVQLGNCYEALDVKQSDADGKITECITDIDTVDSDYSLPIATALLSPSDISNLKNSNIYNKSVLQAALDSK